MNKWLPLLLLLLCLSISFPVLGQEGAGPYYLSLKRELLYGGSGLMGMATGWQLKQNINSITFGELAQPNLLDIDEFEFFEKDLAFTINPQPASDLSDLTLFGSAALPALLLSQRDTRRDFGKIGLLYLETMLINHALTDIAKYTALRPRLYVWTENFAADRPLTSNERASFFSGHTSGSAAASFFFARVFADYFPASRLKPYVWGVAATLPAVTGYLRVKAGKHYPTDVLVGYVVGGAIGYLVPTLHKHPDRERRVRLSPGLGGLSLHVEF